MFSLPGNGDACLWSQLPRRLKQEDCLSLAVPAQLKNIAIPCLKQTDRGDSREGERGRGGQEELSLAYHTRKKSCPLVLGLWA